MRYFVSFSFKKSRCHIYKGVKRQTYKCHLVILTGSRKTLNGLKNLRFYTQANPPTLPHQSHGDGNCGDTTVSYQFPRLLLFLSALKITKYSVFSVRRLHKNLHFTADSF